MFIKARLISVAAFVVVASCSAALAQKLTARANSLQPSVNTIESDRVRDGLVGPVRRVRTEIVKLVSQDGRVVEGKRALLEIVAYDIKGRKVENQYFPVAGATLTGKEVYKYDERGNISEMTLVNIDGSLLSKEIYKYEFDFAGNWNKMTTSVAVVDSGRVSFEPTEVTYRSIMYYLDENMVKMFQTPAKPATQTAAQNNNTTKANPDSKALTSSVVSSAKKSEPQVTLPSLPAVDRVNELGSPAARALTATSNSGSQLVTMDSEPPSPVFSPILKPVSGGVLNGTAISLPTPTYPESAKRMRLSGVVTVSVVVDELGRVLTAHATSGPGPLRDAAITAALKARFSPTKLSGQPVKVSGMINYKFSLLQ